MTPLIEFILSFMKVIGFIPFVVIIFVIGMFIFWRECRIVKKDNNSLFDQWFISALSVALWGRIAYILSVPSVFEKLSWFYLPYERFNGNVYLFRTLPWNYFAIWDGGFLFTAVAFAYLLTNFIFVTFVKKWSWRDMLNPIVLSSQFMLGTALMGFCVITGHQEIFVYTLIFFGTWLLYVIFLTLSRFFQVKVFFLPPIYSILSFSFLGFIFWTQSQSQIDRIDIILLMSVVCLMSWMYLTQKERNNLVIESVSPVRPITITANKAIKLGSLKK